jgi:hypothetical protein
MTARTTFFNKYEWPIGAFLLLVSGLLLFSTITPGHDWGGDFAAYIHQGKALASGSTEHLRALVQHRIDTSTREWIIGPDFYPWGFPALLAIVFKLFGESLFAMKCLIAALTLGCQVVVYFLLRGRTTVFGGYAIATIFAINSFVFVFKDMVLSDIPFTFFVLLTLLLCKKYLLDKKGPTILNLIGIGAAVSMAFSIRTHAIALLPTIAMLQLIGKTDFQASRSIKDLMGGLLKIRLPDFIPYVLFLASVATIAALLSDPIDSYASTGHVQAGDGIISRLFATTKSGILYYGLLPKALFPTPNAFYALVLVPMLMVGVYRAGLKNMDLVVFVIFHMAVLMVFPGRQGLRFVLPVLPIYFLFLFEGGRAIVGWIVRPVSSSERRTLVDSALAAILVLGVSGPTVIHAVQTLFSESRYHVEPGPYTENSQAAFDFISEHVPENDGIVFWKPRVLSYFTERKSSFNFRIEELTNGRNRYALVYLGEYHPRDKGRFLPKTVAANKEKFRSIYSNSDFVLYEILTPNSS